MAQKGNSTPTPADVAALASATTAEPSQIPVVKDATADPVCGTADWLALDTDGDGLSRRLEENQDSDGALRSACGINAAGGQNTGQLGLASPPKVASGSRSGAFS